MSVSYNRQLFGERSKKGVSRKEAAKAIGISQLTLSLYEKGYFKPRGTRLRKIEDYYGIRLDFSGGANYPEEIAKDPVSAKKPKKRKLLISGIVAFLSLGLFFTGSTLFGNSANGSESFFGQTYVEAKRKAHESGRHGRDLVTNLEYSYFTNDFYGDSMILFYKTNSPLYFNTCTLTSNTGLMDMPELGTGRFQFQFGGDMSRKSTICTFSYGSSKAGMFFSADVEFENAPIDHIDHLTIHAQSSMAVTNELVIRLFNVKADELDLVFSKLLTEAMGREVRFYDEFLPAREQGRKAHFSLQVWGLSLAVPSVFAFFISISVFLFALLRLRKKEPTEEEKENAKMPSALPKDWRMPFGVPDYFFVYISRILGYGSLVLLLLFSVLGRFLTLPPFFTSQGFLDFLRFCFVAAPILRLMVYARSDAPTKTILVETLRHVLLHLFVATIETAIVSVAEVWGYDVGAILFRYLPSTIFLVTALCYGIVFFLFCSPSFIKTKKQTVVWRLLSLLPLGLIVAATIVGKSYDLFYGVKQNIYLDLWFSNSNLALSAIAVLTIYATFSLDCLCKKKYGQDGFRFYRRSDRYALTSDVIAAAVILCFVLVDLAFRNNEVAYYLGLGNNLWALALIPFALLCKFGPSGSELARADKSILF